MTRELIKSDWIAIRTKLMSGMLDNVDKNGIYPTTKFYEAIDYYFEKALDALEKEIRATDGREAIYVIDPIQNREQLKKGDLLFCDYTNGAKEIATFVEERGYGLGVIDCRGGSTIVSASIANKISIYYLWNKTDGREELEKEIERLNHANRNLQGGIDKIGKEIVAPQRDQLTALQSSLKEKEKECEELKDIVNNLKIKNLRRSEEISQLKKSLDDAIKDRF